MHPPFFWWLLFASAGLRCALASTVPGPVNSFGRRGYYADMNRTQLFLLLFVVALLAMVFVAMNPQPVAVELAWGSLRLRLGVALVIALALGIIAGVLLRGVWVAELLAQRGRLRRALKQAESRALQASRSTPPVDLP